jgi:phage tail-like protein
MKKTYEYPYSGFHFLVHFEGFAEKQDTSFQSVKGLEVQVDTETIKEGGVNTFEHTIPTRVKYSALTLERGILNPNDSLILNWCKAAFFNFDFKPINLQVQLLNEQHEPLIVWKVRHVLPKSWKIKDLNASQNEVLIETLELSYNAFSVQYIPYP